MSIENDLDIALYKLWEALQVGVFDESDEKNLREKYKELKERNDARKQN